MDRGERWRRRGCDRRPGRTCTSGCTWSRSTESTCCTSRRRPCGGQRSYQGRSLPDGPPGTPRSEPRTPGRVGPRCAAQPRPPQDDRWTPHRAFAPNGTSASPKMRSEETNQRGRVMPGPNAVRNPCPWNRCRTTTSPLLTDSGSSPPGACRTVRIGSFSVCLAPAFTGSCLAAVSSRRMPAPVSPILCLLGNRDPTSNLRRWRQGRTVMRS